MNTFGNILDNKNGLRVIGDVHGNSHTFGQYIEEARALNYAILCLGDITDRGPDSPGAMRLMIDLDQCGDGLITPGNHDWKAARLFMGRKVNVSHGLENTVTQLAEEMDAEEVQTHFTNIILKSNLWNRLTIGETTYVFAHGSIVLLMLTHDPITLASKGKGYDYLISAALYGETDGTKDEETGYPHRTYTWIDKLPNNVVAMIGHDYASDRILTKTGKNGGIVHFVDTGSGKGGHLSYMDITW